MFWECTSLTEASVMSATTVDDYCCHNMFYGCTSLVKAPDLLASTLVENCYYDIFAGCSSLNYVKCLATDVSATNCLTGWLFSTPATGTLVVASGSTWAVEGTNGIPDGWTVTGKMPVTVSGYSGTYDEKAHGITVTAPEGATVKYGTSAGSCTESTSPTYTDAGNYTVYYEITMDNYDPVTGSATVEIAKATGTISFLTDTVEKLNSDSAFQEVATLTGDGTISGYSSSVPGVATVAADGTVTIVSTGTTVITATATDGKNYKYTSGSYTLTVKGGGLNGQTSGEDYNPNTSQDW